MRRLVVLGGRGFFGAAAVEWLRAAGLQPLAAARRAGADLIVDVEDPRSLRAALRPGDVLVDTVGPFQDRSAALLEAALEVGCDLVDIADSLAYVAQVYAREAAIARRGLRVLTACSSISAISATLTRLSAIPDPVRVTGFLVPATRHTANRGSAASLLRSVGRPVQVLRGGRLVSRPGWRETRAAVLPAPFGRVRGRLFESADSLTLPRLWPSLRDVDFFVDIRVPGLNLALAAAARSRAVHALIGRLMAPGLALARALGSPVGCLAFEIEAPGGRVARWALAGGRRGYLTPIVPAVLAARALAGGRPLPAGLVPPDQHVEPGDLLDGLAGLGVEAARLP